MRSLRHLRSSSVLLMAVFACMRGAAAFSQTPPAGREHPTRHPKHAAAARFRAARSYTELARDLRRSGPRCRSRTSVRARATTAGSCDPCTSRAQPVAPAAAPQPEAPQPAPPPVAPADLGPQPSLDAILERLQANVIAYTRTVPNFFCAEHVVSEREPRNSMAGYLKQTTDSTFRLKRIVEGSHRDEFEERRTVRTLNSKTLIAEETANVPVGGPADDAAATEVSAQGLGGPSIVYGVFSSALKLVTLQGRQCYKYKLQPVKRGHEADPYVIAFQALPAHGAAKGCPPFEETEGRVVVDRTLLRVTHIEKRTKGFQISPATTGTWTWSADFVPVLLGTDTFWMPKTVTSKAVGDTLNTGPNTTRQAALQTSALVSPPGTIWRFTATYSDYHKLASSSRMLPFDQSQILRNGEELEPESLSAQQPGGNANQKPGPSAAPAGSAAPATAPHP